MPLHVYYPSQEPPFPEISCGIHQRGYMSLCLLEMSLFDCVTSQRGAGLRSLFDIQQAAPERRLAVRHIEVTAEKCSPTEHMRVIRPRAGLSQSFF